LGVAVDGGLPPAPVSTFAHALTVARTAGAKIFSIVSPFDGQGSALAPEIRLFRDGVCVNADLEEWSNTAESPERRTTGVICQRKTPSART